MPIVWIIALVWGFLMLCVIRWWQRVMERRQEARKVLLEAVTKMMEETKGDTEETI